jgi:hypothetical protein
MPIMSLWKYSPSQINVYVSLFTNNTHTYTYIISIARAFEINYITAMKYDRYILWDLPSFDQLMDRSLNPWPFPPDQLSSQERDWRILAGIGLTVGTFENHLSFGGHTGTGTSHHAYTNCWKTFTSVSDSWSFINLVIRASAECMNVEITCTHG